MLLMKTRTTLVYCLRVVKCVSDEQIEQFEQDSIFYSTAKNEHFWLRFSVFLHVKWMHVILFFPSVLLRRQIPSAWVKAQKGWCRCQRWWNRSCPQDLRLSSSGQRKTDSNPSLPTPTPLLPTTSNCASKKNKARAVTEDMNSKNLKWLQYVQYV